MEETWRMWASSRARIAEAYRRASANIDLEGFLQNSFLRHIKKDVSNHERQKQESKGVFGSEKQIKLKQVVTRLRLGAVLFAFAILGTLALPLMLEDMLPQQMEREFDEVATSNVYKEGGMDETFNRKIKIAQEKNPSFEEEKKNVEIPDDEDQNSTGIEDREENMEEKSTFQGEKKEVKTQDDLDQISADRGENKEENINSEEENPAVEISEEKKEERQPEDKLSAPLRQWRKSGKLKGGLLVGPDMADNGESNSLEDIKAASHEEASLAHDAQDKDGSLTSDSRSLGAGISHEKDVGRRQKSTQPSSRKSRRRSARRKTGLPRGSKVGVNEESKLAEEKKAAGESYAGDKAAGTTEYKEDISTPDASSTAAVTSSESNERTQQDSTMSAVTEQTNDSEKPKSESLEGNDTEENKAAISADSEVTQARIAHEEEHNEASSTSSESNVASSNTGQEQQESLKLALQEAENGSMEHNAGSSEGIDEAFEEVLKLASQSNKTAGGSSDLSTQSQLQSLTEELAEPENKSTELNMGSLEGIDEAFQRIVSENNAEKEEKVVSHTDAKDSVGLPAYEEHKEDASPSEEKEISIEVSHSDRQNETPKVDSLKGDDIAVDNNPIYMEEKNSHHEESNREAGVTHDADEKPTRTSDSEETKNSLVSKEQVTDAGRVDDSNNQSLLTPTVKQTVETRNSKVTSVEENHEAGDTSKPEDGGTILHEEDNKALGSSHEDEVKSAWATHEEKVVNVVVEDQEPQAEVRHESRDDWPQESALITSLRQKTASGTLRIGLLNMKTTDFQRWEFLAGERPTIFQFERVNETVEWKDLYPEWIDEEERYGTPKCPSVPMPKVNPGVQLDVVVVRAPCSTSSPLRDGWRDPAYLQVLLGAASLAVETAKESIYVLVLSECRPLVNLFTCGDLLEHRDQGWLYKVDVEQIRKRLSLPVGSCQLSVPLQEQDVSSGVGASNPQKEAYVTILHSGPDYVCGAIVAASSIRKTGSTKDLVILVDESIGSEHRQGLEEAGWKVREFKKIRKAYSVDGKSYERDFSKFRLWQLTDYNKVVYIDADLLVLRNLDILFKMPEVSASGSTKTMYNSGVMVIEPSNCTFHLLMDEIQETVPEIGGEQDFFNVIFPWWHRIPRHMNYLKYFWTRQTNEVEYMNRLFSAEPSKLYAIHYWGYKPWQCYKDYDCNWNFKQEYASDEAHAQWFKVHDGMPENLQKHCTLSTGKKVFLEYNRRAAEAAAFPDRHWSLNITDPRLTICRESFCDWKALLSRWGDSLKSTKTTTSRR